MQVLYDLTEGEAEVFNGAHIAESFKAARTVTMKGKGG